MNNIPLCSPDIDDDDIKNVVEALNSGWLAHGPKNEEFEAKFAEYCGTKFALSLNSCTSALELALWANNITGEVIIPSFTWCSTGNVVKLQGATPVFADIKVSNMSMDIADVEAKITPKTEAIIVVHYAGLITNIQAYKRLAETHGLLLIEDSAECIGGLDGEIIAGSSGIGCFSFYPTKNFTTCEGGMLTTNDEQVFLKAKALAAHGVSKHAVEREKDMNTRKWYREAVVNGRNFRMPNPLAALGLSQLLKIDKMNMARRAIAGIYTDFLSNRSDIALQETSKFEYHVYQMYPILIENKSLFIEKLNSKGIMASSHFDPPLHQQAAFTDIKSNGLSNTTDVAARVVTLPMSSIMTKDDAYRVCHVIDETLS
jgi:perosamine synthetase